MKITVKQLRKLVESTIRDVLNSKKSLKENILPIYCPNCDGGNTICDGDWCNCLDCEHEWDESDLRQSEYEKEEQPSYNLDDLHQPDLEVGGMKSNKRTNNKKSTEPTCSECASDPKSPGYPGTDIRKKSNGDWFCNGCGEELYFFPNES